MTAYLYNSNYGFGVHLQDLFDVIMSLDHKNPLDLVRFQLFIHHRAFRKLGWRVQEFLTHWGVLPFDILSQHLDPNLRSETFDFAVGPHFHDCIQRYVKLGPKMYVFSLKKGRRVYCVNADNALEWLDGLKEVWSGLQASLLIEHNSNWRVREESPSPATVNDMVTRVFVLEAFMPIFEHLLSAESAGAALHNAGELGSNSGDCSIYVFPAPKSQPVRNRTSCGITNAKDEQDSLQAVLPEDNLQDTQPEDNLHALLPEHDHCESQYL